MKYVAYSIQDREQLPEDLNWLTPGERARFTGFRFDKRRNDWLLGRWAAKNALLELGGLPDSDIGRLEIGSAPSGAPLPRLDGKPYDIGLSISHSNGRAFSVASRSTAGLGCDIERIEPRSAAFVDTFFTDAERGRVERADPRNRDLLITLIWSAKESTLKVLRTGLRMDTRKVQVIDGGDYVDDDWKHARTITDDDGTFNCFWCHRDRWLMSIVTTLDYSSQLKTSSRPTPNSRAILNAVSSEGE